MVALTRSSKRKSEDHWNPPSNETNENVNSNVSIVVRQSSKSSTAPSWDVLKEHFACMAQQWQTSFSDGEQGDDDVSLDPNDPIVSRLLEYKEATVSEFIKISKELQSVSHQLQEKLQARIEQAEWAVQERDQQERSLQATLDKMRAERDSLMEELERDEQELRTLQETLQLTEQDERTTEDDLARIQRKTRLLIPQMKQRISLFASCTGIEFDFDDDYDEAAGTQATGSHAADRTSVLKGTMVRVRSHPQFIWIC